ncbi:MAG: RluA family pseudouridine synthase [Phycisphaerales bacterium]|nr:RluA family pseudouridine synthase [Phycisphaerales bacterium]
MIDAAPDDISDGPPGLIAPGGKVDRDALYDLYARQEESGEGDDRAVSVTFRLARDLAKRLDRYLVDRIPFLSRTALQRLIDEGGVTVNGRAPKASTRLRLGDVVTAVIPPPPSNEIPAEPIPLDVLFEDGDLIVLNKQADLIVHPARGNKSGTLINGLAWHFVNTGSGRLSSVGEELARPGVVHRLDRHTTGAIVAAKTETAHWRLGRQFEQRRVDKRYLAVVHGRMEPPADVIDLPLGKHPTIRERYAVRWDESGKASVTIYRVRELFDEFTLVELELKTGRTHQIRVHLSHIGFPIVGDDLYGGRQLAISDLAPVADPIAVPNADPIADPIAVPNENPMARSESRSKPGPDGVIRRQALHAAILGFAHPISREPMRFQAPLPEDMRRLVVLLRQHRSPEPVEVPGATIDLDQLLRPA